MNIYEIVVLENGVVTTYKVKGSDPVNVAYTVGCPLNYIVSIRLLKSDNVVEYLG